MMEEKNKYNKQAIIPVGAFVKLFEILSQKGYQVVGPTVSDKAIVLDELSSVDQLPIGMIDIQDGGKYRLEKTDSPTLFGFVNGPHSWKKYLHPPVYKLWDAQRTKGGFKLIENNGDYPKRALLGVRACELAAIEIQDMVFTKGPYVDPGYRKRRENSLIIAVNCTRAAGTCFCVSMGTGPKAKGGYDLSLTEIYEGRDGNPR
jgi:sulfhydrogenase subunit beta (sulfur reductase)